MRQKGSFIKVDKSDILVLLKQAWPWYDWPQHLCWISWRSWLQWLWRFLVSTKDVFLYNMVEGQHYKENLERLYWKCFFRRNIIRKKCPDMRDLNVGFSENYCCPWSSLKSFLVCNDVCKPSFGYDFGRSAAFELFQNIFLYLAYAFPCLDPF